MRHPWAEDESTPAFREELLQQLDDLECGAFSPREKAALRFTEQFNYDHLAIDDSYMHELRRSFSDAEVVELAQVVGAYLYRHRLNEVLGLEAR